MAKLAGGILAIIFLGALGGGVYLATFDIPAPVVERDIVLDDDRFPR